MINIAIDKANIDNLTTLWQLMGVNSNEDIQAFKMSQSWPNRCWLDWGVIGSAIEFPKNCIVPIWEGSEKQSIILREAVKKQGFAIASQQIAMFLPLANYHADYKAASLDIVNVKNKVDIKRWTTASSLAFNYEIDLTVIDRLSDNTNIHLIAVKHESQFVATAMLFQSNPQVIGVHQVGVLKGYRGEGVAQALMRYVIDQSILLKVDYVTLQASDAAKSLYKKLGFIE